MLDVEGSDRSSSGVGLTGIRIDLGRSFCAKEWVVLVLVGMFLLFGNLPRFVPTPTGFGNVNVGEVIVYFSVLVMFPVRIWNVMRKPLGRLLVLSTLFSVAVGFIKWGGDVLALSYAVRFIFQIAIACLVGSILAKCIGGNVLRLMKYVVMLYVAIAAAAVVLLVLFPESDVLWAALSALGVEFNGDPHVGRLVSLYFDPNFYATIIVLPAVVAMWLAVRRHSAIYFIFACILMSTIFLSVSRSGISLLVLLVSICMIRPASKFVGSPIISVKTAKIIPVVFLALVVAMLASQEQFDRLLERIGGGVEDDSSAARLDSFVIGQKLFESEPFFGFGYNFALQAIEKEGRLGLDSSLQMFFLTYGFLPAAFTVALSWIYLRNTHARLRIGRQMGSTREGDVFSMWRLCLLYFVLTLLWAGNFNQILFYPFWVIPVFALLFYFIEVGDEYFRRARL